MLLLSIGQKITVYKNIKLHVCTANCQWEFFYRVQKHSGERTSFVLGCVELKYMSSQVFFYTFLTFQIYKP